MENIIKAIRRIFTRKPDSRYLLLALSGSALMVWTKSGNIVLTSQTARKLANQLNHFADISENNHAAN